MKDYIHALLVSLLAIFMPIKAMLITSMVLVTVDFISGVLAAHKSGEPITSQGFRRTVIKAAIYQIAICTAFLAEKYLIDNLLPACKIVAALVGITELKSILENLDIINGAPVFKSMVNRLLKTEQDKIDKE